MGAKPRQQATLTIDRDAAWWLEPTSFPTGTQLAGEAGGPDGVWTEKPSGEKHGRYSHFHADGKKAGEHVYRDGRMHGPCVGWYASGQVEVSGDYRNDAPEGPWSFYRADGSLERVEHYKDGKRVVPEAEKTSKAVRRAQLLAELGVAALDEGPSGDIASKLVDIVGWFRKNAPPCLDSFVESARPIKAAEIEMLEAAIGRALPAPFRAYLELAHGYYRMSFFEYSSLDAGNMLSNAGRIADHGWLPFAEDGGGNLIALDASNRVCHWETQGGGGAPIAEGFDEYLEDYRTKLTSGRYRYDADSGIFDSM